MQAESSPRVTRVDRKHDRKTLFPLTTEERERLLKALKTYNPSKEHPRNRWPWDPVKCLYLVYEHGMHISVLTHPKDWDLHVDAAKGLIRWSRTKTYEHMEHDLTPSEREWVPLFVDSLYQIDAQLQADAVVNNRPAHYLVLQKYKTKDGVKQIQQDLCYVRLYNILKVVADDVGLTGLSTRGLRHTLADRADEASGHNPKAVELTLGVTANVARMYNNRPDETIRKLMREGKMPL